MIPMAGVLQAEPPQGVNQAKASRHPQVQASVVRPTRPPIAHAKRNEILRRTGKGYAHDVDEPQPECQNHWRRCHHRKI